MKNTISHKSICVLTACTFIPFFIMFLYTFIAMDIRHKDDFIETMTRFNDNSARNAIERPIQEMQLLLHSLLGQLTSKDIEGYISPSHTELNSIIPSIVNSTTFFEAVILSDKEGNYTIYPENHAEKFNVKERPWYPVSARKDEIRFSVPYKAIDKTSKYNNGMAVTASMNIFNDHSEFVGNIAFDLDLHNLSALIKNNHPPYHARFKVVSYDGNLLMYSNTKELFKRAIPQAWIERAKESEGHFFDVATKSYVFYRVYDNPEWIAFSIVNEANFKKHGSAEKYFFFLTSLACLIFYLVLLFIIKLYFKQAITALYLNINGLSIDEKGDSIKTVSESLRENSKKLEIAIHDAETDGLTNLFTRKKFDADFYDLVSAKNSFYFAIIDVDNFKTVNDTFGHNTGDVVLTYLSKVGSDIFSNIYRFGGEELVVIYPENNYEKFYTLLDIWRKTLEQKQWREEGLNVTFSCGVSAWHEGSTTDEILKKADIRLYQAKNSGKNCIVGLE
ncbi:sensor domain-containing diguanylate cyclase [Buttiauxella warmboldiae]|uniref:sensor domain-containing diguanylate cyclase n=1 Tax=Buttiauxella warmboldiae TaxID=82993 RepID=UPI00142DB962|nr:sensor domain-containing diguanylate cyclase [Buttiauxella warmboldiae]